MDNDLSDPIGAWFGMTGEDAHEFMNIFMQKFDVDMSELKFDKYFGSEGFDCTSSPETPQK